TRVILDFHLQHAVAAMLPGGRFPAPTSPESLAAFQEWDDWQVLGRLAAGQGGEHGRMLRDRKFFRSVWETPEFPSAEDQERLQSLEEKLGNLVASKQEAGKSWYKVGPSDLPVQLNDRRVLPLSLLSTIVGNMKPS